MKFNQYRSRKFNLNSNLQPGDLLFDNQVIVVDNNGSSLLLMTVNQLGEGGFLLTKGGPEYMLRFDDAMKSARILSLGGIKDWDLPTLDDIRRMQPNFKLIKNRIAGLSKIRILETNYYYWTKSQHPRGIGYYYGSAIYDPEITTASRENEKSIVRAFYTYEY